MKIDSYRRRLVSLRLYILITNSLLYIYNSITLSNLYYYIKY